MTRVFKYLIEKILRAILTILKKCLFTNFPQKDNDQAKWINISNFLFINKQKMFYNFSRLHASPRARFCSCRLFVSAMWMCTFFSSFPIFTYIWLIEMIFYYFYYLAEKNKRYFPSLLFVHRKMYQFAVVSC